MSKYEVTSIRNLAIIGLEETERPPFANPFSMSQVNGTPRPGR